MSVWLDCAIGGLAAIGFICILKEVYDIIFTDYLRTDVRGELFLFGSGTDPETEQALNAAEQIRRRYMPKLAIVFVENGDADPDHYNFAQSIAVRREMEYIE